jgi:flavodoxin
VKTLIIFLSIHHGNTEKIARVMGKALKGELLKPREVDLNTLFEYDLIGFGSGIYFGKYHKSLLNFIDELPVMKNKKMFIFSTSGVKNGILQWPYGSDFNKAIKEKLLKKNFDIIGEFSCRGFDTVGPFKLVGGISKGRPNEKDLKRAENFVKNLKNEMQSLI